MWKQTNKPNKPSKQTKNTNRKKLVKVMCMCEHWPEVLQVCSALGVAPGVKAGALWGRCPGQVLNVGAVPAPSAGSAWCQHRGNPSQTLLLRAQTCRSCRMVLLQLGGGSAALWCPGTAQRWLLCSALVLLPHSSITLSEVAAEAGNSCDHSVARFGFHVL